MSKKLGRRKSARTADSTGMMFNLFSYQSCRLEASRPASVNTVAIRRLFSFVQMGLFPSMKSVVFLIENTLLDWNAILPDIRKSMRLAAFFQLDFFDAYGIIELEPNARAERSAAP